MPRTSLLLPFLGLACLACSSPAGTSPDGDAGIDAAGVPDGGAPSDGVVSPDAGDSPDAGIEAPSNLSYTTNPAIYTVGQAIAESTPAKSGGAVASYTVAPALPAGLALDSVSGILSGTPTVVSPAADYVVTASNSGGSTTATLRITVNDVAPSALAYAVSPATYTKGQAVADNAPSSTGGAVVSYAVDPDLPSGLTLDSSSGVVSGTPTALAPATDYTVTASNTGGSTTATLRITVNDAAPSALTYAVNPVAYTKGLAIAENAPASGGGAAASYAVDPALPAGLALDPASGVLSGTPTELSPAADYTVTASNTGGSTSATLRITVNDVAPVALVYDMNTVVYIKGNAVAESAPSSSGGPVLLYDVAPPLPAGLFLDPSTGILSGTPTELAPAVDYTVTASNTGGSTTATIRITVNDVAPSDLAYDTHLAVYTKGQTIADNAPTNAGGDVVLYAIAPPLPAGLFLDPSSGVISGTPTALAPAADYTVTASNTGGSTTATLQLTVDDVAPSALSYAVNPVVYTKGQAVAADGPTNTGGDVVSYTVDPALPAGLFLDPSTGVLVGTPTALAPAADYTVTASNTGGSTTATLRITVNDAAPSEMAYDVKSVVYTKDEPIGDNAPSSSGGLVLLYEVTPALPTGLLLDPSSGIVSGTPTNLAAAADYTVTASNSGGSTTATLRITVNDAPPANLSYATSPAVYTVNQTIDDNAPSSSGGTVLAYTIEPALPAGISLDPESGVVFGTPTAPTAATGYTVTALNSGGSATTTLTLTVNDLPLTDLAYGTNPAVYYVGTPITANIPSHGGGTATSWSISPSLSSGLAFDPLTGAITGTPLEWSASADHTVTASNGLGSITTTLNLGVRPAVCNGTMVFGPTAPIYVGEAQTALAKADLNGDGKTDLAVTRYRGASIGVPAIDVVTVLLNTGSGSFAPGVDYPTGTKPVALAARDVGGDGLPDLIVANYDTSTVSVFMNLGGGTFAAKVDYPTGSSPTSVAAGDLDGDGAADLAVANLASNTLSVLLNDGSGTFAAKVDYATGARPQSVAIGDVDGDGQLDLAVANRDADSVGVLLNDGAGTFVAAVSYVTGDQPVAVAVVDLNGDGRPELVVANYATRTVSVLLNDGSGSFAAWTETPVLAGDKSFGVNWVEAQDLNGDGNADLAVGGDSVAVLLGTGDGGFSTPTYLPSASTSPLAGAVLDVDGDGAPDVVAANRSSESLSVLRNQGDGRFATALELALGGSPTAVATADLDGNGTSDIVVAIADGDLLRVQLDRQTTTTGVSSYPTGSQPVAVAAGDLDGDGTLDLVTANAGADTVSVFLNDGAGSFAAKVDYATSARPRAVVVSDLNDDGELDLATANADSDTVSVLLNDGTGTFAAPVDYPTGSEPQSLAAGDLDGDGTPDLAVANTGSDTLSVLSNRGDGTFEPKIDHLTGASPVSVAAGILSGSGRLDLVVANAADDTVSVLLNNGNASFALTDYPTGRRPRSVAIGYTNNDGLPDLAVADSESDTVSVLVGKGDGTFHGRVAYPVGRSPVSVTTRPISGLGEPSLIVANELSNSVTELDVFSDGTSIRTQISVGAQPNVITAGDLNGDGSQDLAFLSPGTRRVNVRWGNGDGTFVDGGDYPTGSLPITLKMADLNDDGRPDLALAILGGTVRVLMNDGDGTFATPVDYKPTAFTPSGLEAADVNGDGKLDLLTIVSSLSQFIVQLNHGDGTFAAGVAHSVGLGLISMSLLDMNDDGKLDVVGTRSGLGGFGGGFIGLFLTRNNGDGTFVNLPGLSTGGQLAGTVTGDLTGDGRADLVIARNGGTGGYRAEVWQNNGNSTLTRLAPYVTGAFPTAMVLTDLNGDDALDLAASDGNAVAVLGGNGDGTFRAARAYVAGLGAASVAAIDLNGDGKLDLTTANTSANSISVLLQGACLP